MVPFKPLFRNPHLQTILANYWRRPISEVRFPIERRLYRTEPDVQVCVWTQRPEQPRGDVVMVHGLEGSGDSGYMRSLSAAALEAGYTANRFHMRTCGGTQSLCKTLYHAGLTSDLLSVLRQFRDEGRPPVFLVGFSLGGNVVMKLAGELGSSGAEILRGVCAVSTPLDLEACARRIAHRDNRIYERRFVQRMRARLCATGRYQLKDFQHLHSVRAIDDRITAPSFGFGDAANYYRTQSAIHFLPGIRVPALLIQAEDDTFVPFDVFQDPAVRSNPRIQVISTRYGGHLGFLQRGPNRFWVDRSIMNWIGTLSTGSE